MSFDIVGRENLPNVYIKEIIVDGTAATVATRTAAATVGTTNFNVLLYLYDLKDGNSHFQWYENETLRKYMKVMVVYSSNTQFNSNLESGNYPLTPQHIGLIPGYDADHIGYKLISLQNLSKESLAEPSSVDANGMLYTFGQRCKYTFVGTRGNNSSVYAVCVLDVQQFSLEQDLNLSSFEISAYHGAITGEKVLINGKAPSETNIFFNGESPWAGPVHQRSTGGATSFMAGSKHSELSHPTLSKITVKNRKVKDRRIAYNSTPSLGSIQPRAIFSPIYDSYNASGNLTASFDINIRQFFIQKTKYGKLFYELNENLFNFIISKISLAAFTIFRETVVEKRVTSPIGTATTAYSTISKKSIITTKDLTPHRLRTRYRYYNSSAGRTHDTYIKTSAAGEEMKSSIQEVYLDDSLYTRTFAFTDAELSNLSSGKYRYSVELTFKDPTQDFLKEMIRELKTGLNEFRLYKRKVERRVNYDYNLGQTKEDFVQKMIGLPAWTSFVEIYLKFYNLLFKSSESEINSLGQQIISLVNPRTATISSLESFYTHYLFMFNYVKTFFNTTDHELTDKSTRGSVNVEPNKGKVDLRWVFNQTFDFKRNVNKISFIPNTLKELSTNSLSFPVVYKGEYKALINAEKEKFLKGSPSFTKDQIPILGKQSIEALNDIEEYSFAFLSPLSISIRERIFDLSKVEGVDLFSFNEFYAEFLGSGERKSNALKANQFLQELEYINREKSSFYIKEVKPQEKLEKKENEVVVDSILGIDADFILSEDSPGYIGNNVLEARLKNLFSSFESIGKNDLDINYFIFNSSENIFTKLSLMPSSALFLAKIPLQIKAVMGSKSGFAKTNILKSDLDLFVNPLTRDFIHLLFFSLIKVEFLSGYRKSGDSFNFNDPVWEDLRQSVVSEIRKPILCRMSFYTNPVFRIEYPEYSSYNIENQYFYLNGSGNPVSPEAIDPLTQSSGQMISDGLARLGESLQVPIEFTQTIIMKQPNAKNGPLGFVDYRKFPDPDTGDEDTTTSTVTSTVTSTLTATSTPGTSKKPTTTTKGGY